MGVMSLPLFLNLFFLYYNITKKSLDLEVYVPMESLGQPSKIFWLAKKVVCFIPLTKKKPL